MPWIPRMRDDRLLAKICMNLDVIRTIKGHKLQYASYVMRNKSRYQLINLTLMGKLQARREHLGEEV